MNIFNNFSLIILPYLAIVIFLFGTIYRYRFVKLKFPHYPLAFWKPKKLFWGAVPFHWGYVFPIFWAI